MISKITSRAACLAELASNPNSFSNCPDLHGGVPRLPGGSRPKETAPIARLGYDPNPDHAGTGTVVAVSCH
jgi:hypothetical protein